MGFLPPLTGLIPPLIHKGGINLYDFSGLFLPIMNEKSHRFLGSGFTTNSKQ